MTNDDGIHAPGIVALHDALAAVSSDFDQPFADELLTVAPLTVQSATSHGVTFSEPLMVTDVRVHGEMSGIAV
ncbi:MAG: 5'/3'-nucleotidase SurE, partial [Planctomycetota bacterium]